MNKDKQNYFLVGVEWGDLRRVGNIWKAQEKEMHVPTGSIVIPLNTAAGGIVVELSFLNSKTSSMVCLLIYLYETL